MKVNIECVSGEKHTVDLHDKQVEEFEKWLTNKDGPEVFVYRKTKFTLYIFRSKIECVYYIE